MGAGNRTIQRDGQLIAAGDRPVEDPQASHVPAAAGKAPSGPGFDPAGLRTLLRFARPYRAVMVVGIILGAFGSLAALAQPLAARAVLTAVSGDGAVWPPVLVLLGLVLGSAALLGVQMFVLERTGERMVLGLRTTMIQRLLRLRLREYDRHSTGQLLSRVGSDTTLLRSAVNANVFDAVSSVIVIAGALAAMAYLDWFQLAVVVSVLLVMGLGIWPALRRIRSATQATQEGVGDMMAALERALTALRTVKASVAEDRETELISSGAQRAYDASVRSVQLDAVVSVGSALAVQVSFLVVLGIGGLRVATGAISAPDLVAFLLYVMYLGSPVFVISTAVTQLQRASAAASRIADVDAMEVETDSEHPPASTTPRRAAPSHTTEHPPEVRFAGVTFGYRAGVPVLRELSFTLPAGARAALVGQSGAGKTTVFALIERFYEADEGAILLDGVDIRTLPLAELRRQIGYVEQDAPVLAGTLRDNFRYANPDADTALLAQVVLASQLGDLVARLPDGLDTPVGERGTQLSGGERQRIALGRLLLRRPRLVLLDEATSQLDSVNEKALHTAVDELATGSTFITIAHRLSTVTRSDQIVLLDQGQVRAIGTHTELLASDTLYQTLAQGQLLRNDVRK